MNKSLHNLLHRYTPIVWVRAFGELLINLTGSMIAPFLILYLHEKMGGSVLLPMLIVGLQPLADIFTTLLGGGLTDRFGRKPILLGSLSLSMLSMIGLIFAEAVWAFALVYILNGIGRSLYIPAQRAQIADSVPEEQRSEVFALLNTVTYTGITIGPLIGLVLYNNNPGISFGLMALSFALYIIAIWWKIPETAPVLEKGSLGGDSAKEAASVSEDDLSASKNPSDARLASATLATASGLKSTSLAPTDVHSAHHQNRSQLNLHTLYTNLLNTLHTYRHVLALMICTLPVSFFYAQTETNFRLYLDDSFPNGLEVITTLSVTKALLAILLQIWLVRYTDNWSMPRKLFLAYTCFAATALLYGYSDTIYLLLFAQLILTIGECVGLTHLLGFVSKIAPPDKRGRYFSLFGMHWDISRTAGPAVGALILVDIGGAALFTLAAALLLIGVFAQQAIIHRIQSQPPADKTTSKRTQNPFTKMST